MKFESSHKTIIVHQTVDQINDSVTVLKHFIELNSKLLPALFDLKNIEFPSELDNLKIKKIKNVFDSYCSSADYSLELINSPILELIYSAYLAITQTGLYCVSLEALLDFKKEYNRLKKDWDLAQLN